jgi:hypothetical protein
MNHQRMPLYEIDVEILEQLGQKFCLPKDVDALIENRKS